MVFSTSIFIYLFLPITLLIYYIAPKKSKNFIILLSGLVFYSWGEPIYVVVMLISTMIDYFAGLVMNHFEGKKLPRKLCLIVSVVMNLGLLGVFKYSGFIGVSKPGLVSEDMIKSMAEKPIVFAMANPEPEIMPDKALAAGAYIVGTGRSDFPNQINNVLVFPGIFKGALQCGAKAITEEMKKAAAYAIADIVTPDKLSREYIIPSPLDKSVAEAVATAVEKAAQK